MGNRFGRLWLATSLSAIGTFVGWFALGFLMVDTLKASRQMYTLMAVVQLVSAIAVAPYAGQLADRLSRRRLMIWADAARAVAIATLAIASRVGQLTVAHVIVVAAINSAGHVCFNAAYQPFLTRLVGRESVLKANARVSATVSLAEIVGSRRAAGWYKPLARQTPSLLTR